MPQPKSEDGDDEKEKALHEALREIGEAWVHGDAAALEMLLSPTYTHIDYLGGFKDRAAWLDDVRGREPLLTRVEFRDVRTRLLGDVAVVTGINEIDHSREQPAKAQRQFVRFMQIWIWRERKWLREAFQATLSTDA